MGWLQGLVWVHYGVETGYLTWTVSRHCCHNQHPYGVAVIVQFVKLLAQLMEPQINHICYTLYNAYKPTRSAVPKLPPRP